MTTTSVRPVEIEVDTPRNSNLHFRPLQRSIRGRFDWNRIREPQARLKSHEWPVPIPPQRLGIDADGNGYLVEPLHDEEHAAIREQIEDKLNEKLEPARQEFPGVHIPTWLFWIKRAVESGIARIVKGELPAVIDGTPKRNFIIADRKPNSADKLTAAIEAQTEAFNQLTAALTKVLAKGK
jgi:hypothetical protein